MKKMLSVLLSIALVFSISMNAFANEIPNDKSTKKITEKEAIELARWFIANDIYENKNDGWSEDTVIDTIEEDNGDSYIIKLKSDSRNNGYIVVGKDISNSLIKEFAYEGEPLFVNLVPLPTEMLRNLESRTSEDYKKIDQTEENLPYLLAVRENLNNRSENRDYGGITNPYSHVNSTYGSGWSYHSDKTISGFTSLDMDDFNASNHCSLTTMTAIFNYHRTHGYPSISSNINTLFNRIKTIATNNGYYTPSNGTMPYYIDNLATDVWSYYGYSGTGNNDFFFWDVNSINSTLKGEVDGNRPGAISFTSGYYGDHTVTYYGYVFYKKSGQSNKMYLKVNDNWTTATRYIDTTHIGELGETLFEICRVLP